MPAVKGGPGAASRTPSKALAHSGSGQRRRYAAPCDCRACRSCAWSEPDQGTGMSMAHILFLNLIFFIIPISGASVFAVFIYRFLRSRRPAGSRFTAQWRENPLALCRPGRPRALGLGSSSTVGRDCSKASPQRPAPCQSPARARTARLANPRARTCLATPGSGGNSPLAGAPFDPHVKQHVAVIARADICDHPRIRADTESAQLDSVFGSLEERDDVRPPIRKPDASLTDRHGSGPARLKRSRNMPLSLILSAIRNLRTAPQPLKPQKPLFPNLSAIRAGERSGHDPLSSARRPAPDRRRRCSGTGSTRRTGTISERRPTR